MPLKVCVLASGSSGNCILIASPATRLLIDAGLSCRQIEERLQPMGFSLEGVHGLCITHEHTDHTSALAALHRRTAVPLFASAGTIEAVERLQKTVGLPWNVFTTGQSFPVGDLAVTPFSVPHDSLDPVGFVVAHGELRVGVVTDMGVGTNIVRQRLKNCDVLVLEANHDERLLQAAKRPWALKQRIAGHQGHLSNRQAGELAVEIAGPATRAILLAHLSSDCNRPELALRTVRDLLDRAGLARIEVKLTYADRASDVVDV